MNKVAIIGYGSMGKMLADKLLEKCVVDEEHLFVSNRTKDKMNDLVIEHPSITICSNSDSVKNADIIFICVRPVDMKDVFEEIKCFVTEDKHIISLNGSIQFEQMESVIYCKLSKVIPSVNAEVNESQTLVCHSQRVMRKDKEELKLLLKCFGSVIELPEHEMGMGAELVSCMPGFLAAIVKEMAKSAEQHTELDSKTIIRMIFETMYGTAKLVAEKDIEVDALIQRVATKGGITEEGTQVIEREFSKVTDEMFERTLEKRKHTTESARSLWNI